MFKLVIGQSIAKLEDKGGMIGVLTKKPSIFRLREVSNQRQDRRKRLGISTTY
jgi:hypothetical protein